MATGKMTKRDYFNALKEIEAVRENEELTAFINHELELLETRAQNRSTKPTAAQIEREEIKDAICETLEPDKWYRLAEIKALIPALANDNGTQRVSALCNALATVNRLDKIIEKRVVYFKLP